MLKEVKTKTEVERRADETREIKEDMTSVLRKDLHNIKDELHILQVRETLQESLLEAIRVCDENARFIKQWKNGYITGHELVHSLILITPQLRYHLAMTLLELAEMQLNQ